MPNLLELGDYIRLFPRSPLARFSGPNPWELTAASGSTVRDLSDELQAADFAIEGEIAIHRTATV